VGDYDEATFNGEVANDRCLLLPPFPPVVCYAHSSAERFEAISQRDDTYKVVVIEGAHGI
jgi:hypothetical protein